MRYHQSRYKLVCMCPHLYLNAAFLALCASDLFSACARALLKLQLHRI